MKLLEKNECHLSLITLYFYLEITLHLIKCLLGGLRFVLFCGTNMWVFGGMYVPFPSFVFDWIINTLVVFLLIYY